MSLFQHTTGFTRGEIDPSLRDRFDVDFYQAASEFMENWLPDRTGSIQRRPGIVPAFATGTPGAYVTLNTDVENFPGDELGEDGFVGQHIEVFTVGGRDYVVIFLLYEGDQFTLHVRAYEAPPVTTVFTLRRTGLELSVESNDVDIDPTLPLSQQLTVATVGPSMFVTWRGPTFRIFFDASEDDLDGQEVEWYEEIVGTLELENGNTTVTGEDTLFEEQVDDVIRIRGVLYDVASVTDNTTLELSAAWAEPSLAAVPAEVPVLPGDVFGGGDQPRLCAFHQGRLHLFSSTSRPTTWWASRAQDPFTIKGTNVRDDAPIEYELLAEGVDRFVWVQVEANIYLGSSSGEYVISSDRDLPLTPTAFGFRRISSIGGAPLRPFSTEASTVFLNRSRDQLVAARFDEARQGFTTEDVTFLAPHLFVDRVQATAFRPANSFDRVPRIFALLDNGEIRACAFDEAQQVIAWSRITVDPALPIKAIATSSTDAYFLVRRGADFTVCALDRTIATGFGPDFPKYWTMDGECFTTFDGETLTLIDDLLAGQTLLVLSPTRGFLGFFTPDENNQIDLSELGLDPSDELRVGLAFRSRVELLPVMLEDGRGGTLNRKHRLIRVMLSVRGAYQLFVNEEPLFGNVGAFLGQELPEREGTFERRFLGWAERDRVSIESATIYRAQILSITREVNV
jgi:hypothetical protein